MNIYAIFTKKFISKASLLKNLPSPLFAFASANPPECGKEGYISCLCHLGDPPGRGKGRLRWIL